MYRRAVDRRGGPRGRKHYEKGTPRARRRYVIRKMDGRAYFKSFERELKIDKLDPDAIQHLPPLKVKRGSVESKLGGRITRDLKRLSPEQIAVNRRLSEEFLKQPVETVPAEEDGEA